MLPVWKLKKKKNIGVNYELVNSIAWIPFQSLHSLSPLEIQII